MPRIVTLDAMIPRADFCESDDASAQSEKIQSLGLSQLDQGSYFLPNLHKPDFQRETNQWSIDQVIVFLKSFLDNELVPSVILWKSPGKIFVIDGAHRLSALIAWIRDDYGDGIHSKTFYGDNISKQQQSIANSLRKKISEEIGSFVQFKEAMINMESIPMESVLARRASNATTRTLALQWVEGDAEKAESSFFKINKQGTSLDKTEERLLLNRRQPIAIGSRAIVRAGSGHKYWSKFDESKKNEIESLAEQLHRIMFSPEIEFPIKTLNLPHGGQASPIEAYNILMDLFGYVIHGNNKTQSESYLYSDDDTGKSTIRALNAVYRVMSRITGNDVQSLGLHPAVYFYSSTGKHWDTIFVAMVNVIAKAVRSNNSDFFRNFTKRRKTIETVFLKNKSLIAQANQAIYSRNRVQKWSDLIEKLSLGRLFSDGISQDEILDSLDLKGRLIASEIKEAGTNFSSNTKSALFLKNSIERAQSCPLCGGLIVVEKSVSFDHIVPKGKGGKGNLQNAQMTHPYCNSIKGDQ